MSFEDRLREFEAQIAREDLELQKAFRAWGEKVKEQEGLVSVVATIDDSPVFDKIPELTVTPGFYLINPVCAFEVNASAEARVEVTDVKVWEGVGVFVTFTCGTSDIKHTIDQATFAAMIAMQTN